MSDSPDVIVYTDGACKGNPGPGGWAALLVHPASETIKKLSGGHVQTTNNRMELTAAIEGLKAIKPGKDRRVRLVSDSEYVILGITEWIKGWMANDWRKGKKRDAEPVKNADLWKALYEVTQRFEMSYAHVRGHTGHPENEECDRLANIEIKRLFQGEP